MWLCAKQNAYGVGRCSGSCPPTTPTSYCTLHDFMQHQMYEIDNWFQSFLYTNSTYPIVGDYSHIKLMISHDFSKHMNKPMDNIHTWLYTLNWYKFIINLTKNALKKNFDFKKMNMEYIINTIIKDLPQHTTPKKFKNLVIGVVIKYLWELKYIDLEVFYVINCSNKICYPAMIFNREINHIILNSSNFINAETTTAEYLKTFSAPNYIEKRLEYTMICKPISKHDYKVMYNDMVRQWKKLRNLPQDEIDAAMDNFIYRYLILLNYVDLIHDILAQINIKLSNYETLLVYMMAGGFLKSRFLLNTEDFLSILNELSEYITNYVMNTLKHPLV